MIYLDTHVVVWLYAFGAEKLSKRARELMEQPSSLLISPMVLLEWNSCMISGRLQ